MFWGWVAEHDREGALADIPYAGLRIRMHNIAVGDHTIIEKLFTHHEPRSMVLWGKSTSLT